jgi:hypothetical protein
MDSDARRRYIMKYVQFTYVHYTNTFHTRGNAIRLRAYCIIQYYYWREIIRVVSPVALKAIRSYECCCYIVFTTCILRYHY